MVSACCRLHSFVSGSQLYCGCQTFIENPLRRHVLCSCKFNMHCRQLLHPVQVLSETLIGMARATSDHAFNATIWWVQATHQSSQPVLVNYWEL